MLRHTMCSHCLQPIVLLITESGPVVPCDPERTSWRTNDGHVQAGYITHVCNVGSDDVDEEELH